MSISEAVRFETGALGAPVARPRATAIPALVSTAVVAREAAVVGVVVAGLALLLAPRDLGGGLAPHPGWAAVILLSARYGSRGFALAFSAVWGALAALGLGLGLGLPSLVTAAGSSVGDLGALVVCVLVAWISSAHERRLGDLAARATELERRSDDDGSTMAALRDAALALRARADRVDHSLTFLRDVSARLEGDDARASSHAALELALARTGAGAGVVRLVERGGLRTVASIGAWPDGLVDRTIAAAVARAAPARALDLGGAGADDSDVATPMVDPDGRVLGVLALRGVPSDSLSHALVHDLGIVARWCAKATAPRATAALEPAAERDRPPAPRDDGDAPARSHRAN